MLVWDHEAEHLKTLLEGCITVPELEPLLARLKRKMAEPVIKPKYPDCAKCGNSGIQAVSLMAGEKSRTNKIRCDCPRGQAKYKRR